MQDTQAGIHSLVEYLKTQKRIDPSQIGIIGASFGAPFALDAAARNSDIHTIAIVHGFADVEGVLKHRLRQILEKKWGILSNPASFLLSKLILLYLNPPDITQAANQLRPSQRVLIIEAKNDRFIPLAVREQLWNSLSESNASIKRVRLPGDHLQPGTQDQINEMIKIIESWQKEPTR
jgi:dienelactone hydrolase